MDVSGIARSLISAPASKPAEAEISGSGFSERLLGLLAETNRLQNEAESKSADMVAGKADSVETVIALSKADLALKLVVNLRNRALEAYQEILRLQV